MGKFGQDAGFTPLLFFEGHPGIFNTTESQDLGLTSHPKDEVMLQLCSKTDSIIFHKILKTIPHMTM